VGKVRSDNPRIPVGWQMLRNFLIVGTQRTGSTALVRSLTFHPDVACGGEWTQHVPSHRKLWVAEQSLSTNFKVLSETQRNRIENVFSQETRWLGFKLLFRSSAKWIGHPKYAPALWFDRFEAFTRWIAARPELHVIHIVRSDPIEWLKSKYLADTTHFYTGKEYPRDLKIEVPVKEALRRLQTKRWIDEKLAGLEVSNPYRCVRYEEFAESNREIINMLMAFLDCDTKRLREFDYRKQVKQARRSASEYIANYRQLAHAIQTSNFA
jgi:hypothetical protein